MMEPRPGQTAILSADALRVIDSERTRGTTMPVRVIAEIGTANHDIDYALECVKQVAGTGVFAVKMQLLNADTLVARDAPRYDRLEGPKNQYEQFKDAPPYEDWEPVFKDARERGLEVFASCWDEAAVEWCESQNVSWYKVGSADITNLRLLSTIAATGKDVMFSTGAATLPEIDNMMARFTTLGEGRRAIPMACTLSYPCDPNDARLERITFIANDYNTEVGYSDHTRGIRAAGLAVAAGATYLEKHFTTTPGAGGDHDFALSKPEMTAYVWAAEEAYRMTYSGTPIGEPLQTEVDARRWARRSLHATSAIEVGEGLVVGENCAFLRPGPDIGVGIGAEMWTEDYMGDAVKDLRAGEQI